jgi:hypothetical protein
LKAGVPFWANKKRRPALITERRGGERYPEESAHADPMVNDVFQANSTRKAAPATDHRRGWRILKVRASADKRSIDGHPSGRNADGDNHVVVTTLSQLRNPDSHHAGR